MNISAKTASKHVRNENARIAGVVTHNEREYIIIERLDIQRTDHTEFDLAPMWMSSTAEVADVL